MATLLHELNLATLECARCGARVSNATEPCPAHPLAAENEDEWAVDVEYPDGKGHCDVYATEAEARVAYRSPRSAGQTVTLRHRGEPVERWTAADSTVDAMLGEADAPDMPQVISMKRTKRPCRERASTPALTRAHACAHGSRADR